ncbi:MAG: ExeM/NucH family extracellular endonuclease, partial [Anaerolineae bacterium]|nr:ExeM/NucH family extracellular endonuclease [Anaerolineae bacterium]
MPIHDIQKSGTTSPLVGMEVTISGIVVGDYQNTINELSGFFVQEENSDSDANAQTSEGIFVFDNGFGVDVSVGDLVEVTGSVLEFTSTDGGLNSSSLTEISSPTVVNIVSSGNPLPLGATIALPVTDLTDFEPFEGMLVNFPQTLFVTEHFLLGRFGQITLSSSSRLLQPTHATAPGTAALAYQAANDKNRIVLDDTSTLQNPDPILYPQPAGLTALNTLRGGDTTTGLSGVLDHRFGLYRIQPTGTVTFSHTNLRPMTPSNPGGNIKVASFNVLNYFSTLDDSGNICGPLSNLACRGADSAQEFTRQREKLFSALTTMNVDIVGLIEIENHATDVALDDFISGLNAVIGAGTYTKINTGTIGDDAIKVAFIYKPTTVSPFGSFAILDDTFDPNFHDDKNRPALAQTFIHNVTGEKFTVVVNHFKSKGSSCNDIGDLDAGDGQGNCNSTRTDAANVLVNWLTTDPTTSGDPDFLIIGDLNAYAMEDPITVMGTGGYTDLVSAFLGADAYSYLFDGQ